MATTKKVGHAMAHGIFGWSSPELAKVFEAGWRAAGLVLVTTCALAIPSFADAGSTAGITFEDLATVAGSGLDYERVPSTGEAAHQVFRDQGFMFFFDIPQTPIKGRGAPGTAILDYDLDGDLDIFVTNGPGASNSLFTNQLRETGETTFIDDASMAGVSALAHDSSGVCFGDTDNDGDQDLLVLSGYDENLFFVNNGDATFTDNSAVSGLVGDTNGSMSCSFGDIDGDGLLDVAVANCCNDMTNQFHTGAVDPFDFNEPNRIYRNTGGNVFVDVTTESGILALDDIPAGKATITWAIALVDYDQDGDVDLVHADDQANLAFERYGGLNRGYVQIFENDGTGLFSPRSEQAGLLAPGAWMGLSFGDLNGDHQLDFFATNLGDYASTLISPLDPVYGDFFPYLVGDNASRWFLNQGNGSFSDPGVGDLGATPFGWGTAMLDYDNDADTDILFHGGLNPGPVIQGAPAALLRNDGSASFERDSTAFADSTNHQLRTVQGLAVGDLDDNGFVDVVTVSNYDIPADAALGTYNVDFGSPFDFGTYQTHFEPTETPFLLNWSGVDLDNGSLSVELSSGNQSRWFKLALRGTADLPQVGGRSNRDGIGAVVSVSTSHGARTSRPLLGGSSYASQNSLEMGFGLGQARRAVVDILWPGGTKNRLYGVRAGERLTLPEVPCSYDDPVPLFVHMGCVSASLHQLQAAGELDRHTRRRLFVSALIAYIEENY